MDRDYLEKIKRLLDSNRLSLGELRDIKQVLENEDDSDPEVKELKLTLSRKL